MNSAATASGTRLVLLIWYAELGPRLALLLRQLGHARLGATAGTPQLGPRLELTGTPGVACAAGVMAAAPGVACAGGAMAGTPAALCWVCTALGTAAAACACLGLAAAQRGGGPAAFAGEEGPLLGAAGGPAATFGCTCTDPALAGADAGVVPGAPHGGVVPP